jgi:hypothetical protein
MAPLQKEVYRSVLSMRFVDPHCLLHLIFMQAKT